MSIQRLPDSRPATAKTRSEMSRQPGEKSPLSFADILARGQKKPPPDPTLLRKEHGEGILPHQGPIEIEPSSVAAGQTMELPAGSIATVVAAISPSEGTAATGGTAAVGANQQLLDRLVEQVVTAARTLDGGRGQHLQLSLNLGALGQAEVELRKDAEGALDLLFRCDDAAAEGELQQNLNALRRRLLDRGLRPGRLAVGDASELSR